jgi:ATP-dependent DNA helicase PIF1
MFSPEQQLVYDKYLRGENIFMTGPGGTGKSYLIRHIQKDAYRKCMGVEVCALTGCAAVLLECKAKTVHSWAGIGLGNGSPEYLINKVMKNQMAKQMWKETDLLIIDEVSMMSQKLFETLNMIGKTIRRNSKPFGGIQLIFSGDFYQLPPVGDKDEPETTNFCFESPLWEETFPKQNHIQLVKIYRQTDEIYQKILNQLREGRLKRSSNELLLQNVEKEVPANYVVRPTKLYPTRAKVDNLNLTEYLKLQGEEYIFKIKRGTDGEMTATERRQRMYVMPQSIEYELDYLQGNLRCDQIIKLKVGSQVMCIVNIKNDYGIVEVCNGSQGIVVGFTKRDDVILQSYPIVKYNNGKEMVMSPNVWKSENIPGVYVSQVPLILAWALTIHKAQGATMDCAEIDAGSSIFECGQTYVALSRVKNIEGLFLSSFDARRVKINKKVQRFYESLGTTPNETNLLVEAYAEPIAVPVAGQLEIPVAELVTDE